MISVSLYHDKHGKTNFCGSDSIGYFDGRKTLRTCIIEQKKRHILSKNVCGEYNNGYARFFIGDLLYHHWISGYVYIGDIPQCEYDKVVSDRLAKIEQIMNEVK